MGYPALRRWNHQLSFRAGINSAGSTSRTIATLAMISRCGQKEEWLRPLAAGESRSCFMMTEPAPGAGSDPSMLRTTARRDDVPVADEGGRDSHRTGARHLGPVHGRRSRGRPAGRFTVPESAVLGRVGAGFRYAQVRLAPARLTHCMRWLGAACRAHDIAADYARRRTAFGKPIGEHEGVGFMLADNEMDIHQSRLVIWHAAWVLDRGERGAHESSMAKVICSEAIWRVVDRSIQILGGLGITDDTIVARLFREIRPFRIYDGPSEVHRWSIARRVLRTGGAAS